MSDLLKSIQVNSSEFTWNCDQGVFSFDGASSILLWDDAVATLFRTIIEVSGEDTSTAVFEATGYRMGELVSDYYGNRFDLDDAITNYSDIYKSAGWGNITISHFSQEEKRIIVQLKNSWEHRIFQLLNREQALVLLPSHWAGVFSGLLKENMWYKMNKSQMDGYEWDEIEIFPSTITPNNNIHELARQKEQEYINELEIQVENRTKEMQTLIKHLSTPVMPVFKGVLAIPLVGSFNDDRFEDLLQKALYEFSKRRATYLLLDLTGISEFDSFIIFRLQGLIKAVNLLGGECILVGIGPSLSLQITNSGVDLTSIHTFATLEDGMEYAIDQLGYEIKLKE